MVCSWSGHVSTLQKNKGMVPLSQLHKALNEAAQSSLSIDTLGFAIGCEVIGHFKFSAPFTFIQ
jgi:hypothetical protein